MPQIPAKVTDRISTALKRFQPILSSAQTRDVNESDTSIIVTDLLSDMFGYDKYSEITREHAIRGTFCDLAIKIDNEIQFIIEVEEAKVTNFRFHDLRHTAATRMADAGVDAFTIAAILGHADLRMTARYTHA